MDYKTVFLGYEIRGLETLSTRIWSLADRIGRYGKFNFLLSNGECPFIYMNRDGTLYYLLRHSPHHRITRLLDEDFEVRLEELKAPDEYAAIIAAQPLTSEACIPTKPDTLYVFHRTEKTYY